MGKFMLLLKATADSESGKMPDASVFQAMIDFNASLVEAGVLMGAEGLASSSEAQRIIFSSAPPSDTYVKKGPSKSRRSSVDSG